MIYGVFECKFCDMLHIVASHSLGKERCILNTVFVLVEVPCRWVYRVCMYVEGYSRHFLLRFVVIRKYVHIEDFVTK